MTVNVTDLKVEYDGVSVLDDCNLEIRQGELFVLLGPSGCGKSTLLKTIAGLHEARKGIVEINGRNVSEVAVRDRDLAFIMETWALYPDRSVRENILYPLKLKGVLKERQADLLEWVSELTELSDLLSRKPSQLSAGQKQRVAIARALVREDAKLLLADEAFSNLDAELRQRLRIDFKQHQIKSGKTCIFVTHSQAEAMSIADRVAVMRAGRILQVGTTAELYHDPCCAFVAGFIGNPPMNFLSIQDLPHLAPLLGPRLTNSMGVSVAVRPELVELVPCQQASISGEIFLVEPSHPNLFLHIRLANSDGKVVALASDRGSYSSGEMIGLKVVNSAWMFFDESTGNRIRRDDL